MTEMSGHGLAQKSHGELKRRLAELIGTNPDRYADEIGVERHKRLSAREIDRITEAFGMGIVDEPKQQQRDAIMIRLGRDHRTGIDHWDSSDLMAVLEGLEEHEEPKIVTDGGAEPAAGKRSQRNAFRTTYECHNCGNEWGQDHPPRTTVEKSTGLGGVVVYDTDCDQFVTSDCDCCSVVVCPVCEMSDSVSVSDRNPIEEGSDDV